MLYSYVILIVAKNKTIRRYKIKNKGKDLQNSIPIP